MKKDFVLNRDNVRQYAENISAWIKNQVEASGREGVVLGMSGGIDCSVVAALCQKAGVNTHLIIMPYGENMKHSGSYLRAKELIEKFDFDYHEFDIKPACKELKPPTELLKLATEKNRQLSRTNTMARTRMSYLYQVAQLRRALVVGTSNLSEWYTGYFTKWGDGVADIEPIIRLTKTEVRILAEYLELPQSIIKAAPTADLSAGQTDEDDLGFSYEVLDQFIINGLIEDKDIEAKIKTRHQFIGHKINQPPYF